MTDAPFGKVRAQPGRPRSVRGQLRCGSAKHGARTSQNLPQVLVELEPVREQAEEEQEHGEAKEHERRHHRCREPDLPGRRRDEPVTRQSSTRANGRRKGRCRECGSVHRGRGGRRAGAGTYISVAASPSLISARAVKPGGPHATNAPFAWWPSRKPVCGGVVESARGARTGACGSGTRRHNSKCGRKVSSKSEPLHYVRGCARTG